MKVKGTEVFKNFDGKPLTEEGKEITLKSVLIFVLTYQSPQEIISGEQKIRNFDLCMELSKQDEVLLKAEDIVYIKKTAEKCLTVLTYGRLVNFLEVEETK